MVGVRGGASTTMSCMQDTNVANFGLEEGELGKPGILTLSPMVLCCHLSLVPGDTILGLAWAQRGHLLLPPTGIHYFQCPARPDLKCIL